MAAPQLAGATGAMSRQEKAPASGALAPGTRVRLRGRGPSYTLTADTGTVVRPDAMWDGYWIICLDEPATYHRPDGTTEPLREIREFDDNLIVLNTPGASAN